MIDLLGNKANARTMMQNAQVPVIPGSDGVVKDIDRAYEIAEKLGVEVLGKMPIDPKLAEIVEQEKFYEADNQYLKNIIDKFN